MPTEVLLDARTKIDSDTHTIYAHNDLVISAHRTNGTIKDIDLLVFTKDQGSMARIRSDTHEAIRWVLPDNTEIPAISISGYDLISLADMPWLQIVSQTIKESSQDIYLKLGHVVEAIDPATLEDTWSIRYRDDQLKVLHPISHLMSYRTRSITGVRPKDRTKVNALEALVHDQFSDNDWKRFESWKKFEERIHNETKLNTAIKERDPRHIALAVGRIALHLLEQNPYLVKLAQQKDGVVASLAQLSLQKSKPSFFTDRSV